MLIMVEITISLRGRASQPEKMAESQAILRESALFINCEL